MTRSDGLKRFWRTLVFCLVAVVALVSPLGIAYGAQDTAAGSLSANGPSPWVADKIIYDDGLAQSSPALATDHSQHLWAAFDGPSEVTGYWGIRLMESEDWGATWAVVSSHSIYRCDLRDPDIAIDPYDDRVYVVYEYYDRDESPPDYDILCATYTPGAGASWDIPVDTDEEDDRHPSVACEYEHSPDNRAYIAYEYVYDHNDRDLMLAKSVDDGRTWTTNKLEGGGSFDGNVHMETDTTCAQGKIFVAYRHSEDFTPTAGESEIWVDISSDRGQSFDQVKVMDDSARPVSNPSVAASHGGNTVVIGYEYEYSSSDTDVYYAYSTDSGSGWSAFHPLMNTSADESLPSLTVDGCGRGGSPVYGNIHAVYNSGGYLYYTSAPCGTPTSWASPQQVNDSSYAWSGDTPAITAQERTGGAVEGWFPCVAWTDTAWSQDLIRYSTPGMVPSVDTEEATRIGQNQAQLNGYLMNPGTALLPRASFEWGQTTGYGHTTSVGIESGGPFGATISGLDPGTTYHYRARAEGDGMSYGPDKTFTTLPFDPVSAVVQPAAQVVDQGATFSVDIEVDLKSYSLFSGELNVAFDPSVMSADDIVVGDLWEPDPLEMAKEIDNAAGTIHYSLSYFLNRFGPNASLASGGDPSASPGAFATITFTVKSMAAVGTYPIDITSIALKDYSFVPIPSIVITDGTVTIHRPVPPVVTTNIATGRSYDAATLNGTLSDLGSAASVQVSFEWGLDASYGNTTTPQTLSSPDVFSARITGLSPGTTYHFRAVAAGDGVALGDDASFRTPSLDSPLVNTVAATGTTFHSSTLRGTLTSRGTAMEVRVFFQWGLTTDYGNATAAQVVYGRVPLTFGEDIGGLEPATTYHFRAVAVAAGGATAYGDDLTFTTTEAVVEWDINQDGKVDYKDLAMLGAAYGTASGDPGFNASADINQDGAVNYKDLAMLGAHYGESY